MQGGNTEELKFKKGVIWHFYCSLHNSMPSVKKCNVNSHENEKKDIEFIGRDQTADC